MRFTSDLATSVVPESGGCDGRTCPPAGGGGWPSRGEFAGAGDLEALSGALVGLLLGIIPLLSLIRLRGIHQQKPNFSPALAHWAKDHCHVAAVLLGFRLNNAVFRDVISEAVQQPEAKLRAGLLAATEHDGYLDL